MDHVDRCRRRQPADRGSKRPRLDGRVAIAAPAALWVVAVPLLGAQTGDRPPPQVGLSSLVATAALASLVGWGLLVALPCRLGRARTVWTAAAVAVLLVSFGPLLVPGATTMTTTRVTLALMALATAAVLVPGLRRSSPMR